MDISHYTYVRSSHIKLSYIHTYIRMYIHAYVHMCVCMFQYKIQLHMYSYMYIQYVFQCNTYTQLRTYIHTYVSTYVCNPPCPSAVLILWVSWILPPVTVESSSSSRGEESLLLVPPTPQLSSRSCHIQGNTTYSSFFKKFETTSVESSQVCIVSFYVCLCTYSITYVYVQCLHQVHST